MMEGFFDSRCAQRPGQEQISPPAEKENWRTCFPLGRISPAWGTQSGMITTYITANAIASQTIEENAPIIYGENTAASGCAITHEANTGVFSLAGGRTYYLALTVNSNAAKATAFYYAVKLGEDTAGVLHASISAGYNAATTYLCFSVPEGETKTLQIINACGEEVFSVNSSISLIQIA